MESTLTHSCHNTGCRKSFRWPMQLFRHKSKCKFPQSPAVKKKKYTRLENGTFKCNTCQKVQKLQPNMIRHIKDQCGKKKPLKQAICQICSKDFKYKSFLKKHMHVHEKNHTQTCLTCNTVFRRKDHFISHQVHCFLPTQINEINQSLPNFPIVSNRLVPTDNINSVTPPFDQDVSLDIHSMVPPFDQDISFDIDSMTPPFNQDVSLDIHSFSLHFCLDWVSESQRSYRGHSSFGYRTGQPLQNREVSISIFCI